MESLGLEGEIVDKLVAQHEAVVAEMTNGLKSELEAAKADAAEKGNELEAKTAELEAANSTITKLGNSNKDNESLLKEVEKYKEQVAKVQEDAKRERVEWTVETALIKAGAINPKTVKPLIDFEKVIVGKDGSVAGVSEQVDAIKANEEYAFLFKSEKPPEQPETVRGGYDPLAGQSASPESPELTSPSIGALAAKRVTEGKQTVAEGLQNFWSNTGGLR